MKMLSQRACFLKKTSYKSGPVVYWMGRDQRSRDNWALIFAQQKALSLKVPLVVVFCLVPKFLQATIRQYDFMLKGLEEVEINLKAKNIPFIVLTGELDRELPNFLQKIKAGLLVTDFEPLKIKMAWKKTVAGKINFPFYEVDARNIVPCWQTSAKQEFAARTIRRKIHDQLPDYLEKYPAIKKHPYLLKIKPKVNWNDIRKTLKVDEKVKPVQWLKPGQKAGLKVCNDFIRNSLKNYDHARNDPNQNGPSNLSPYLHFGQISSLTIAHQVKASGAPAAAKQAFLEELIVRRELADNFCFYNPKYDSFRGLPHWAQKTLNEHRKDKRQYIYSLQQLEQAETHDLAWNAAQRQMVETGKMHGYMRMYWAKKILEWSATPETAIKNAIYLNDKYELDGRDPNGYAGIMWSIGGLHDRAWNKNPIFGKIRYMSFNGLKAKFKLADYIAKFYEFPVRAK
ncbi:MAG: deoxyribodipyrimidine photo-lyase [Pseudomonadota bacterium]